MLEFTKRAALSERSLKFTFRSIYNKEGDKYFVVVKEGRAEIGKFEMVSNGRGSWRIADPAPPWAKAVEDQLIMMVLNPVNEQRTYVLRQNPEEGSRMPDGNT